MKKTWVKYRAEVCPKQKIIKVQKVTYKSNNPNFMKGTSIVEVIDEIPIIEDIPMENYTTTKEYFDNKALQMDDRIFSVELTGKRYSPDKIRELQKKALENYPKEPSELI